MKFQGGKNNLPGLVLMIIFIAFAINPVFGIITIFFIVFFLKKNKDFLVKYLAENLPTEVMNKTNTIAPADEAVFTPANTPVTFKNIMPSARQRIRLEKRKKYLQVALNSTLTEAGEIIARLPVSDRIIIEVGTPLIKIYGVKAVKMIKAMAPASAYVVADNKCADLAPREVEMMVGAGANAATCLGVAPSETIDSFIEECEKYGIDSMVDMMNVENPQFVLKKLKKLPTVVILHRGVDESEFSKEKQIPFYQIKQIKGAFDVLAAVAGGDTPKEIERAVFNDADIVVVWKNFYQVSGDTGELAEEFLKEVK